MKDYIKKFIKVLKYPIILTLVTYLINYIFVCIYNSNLGVDNNELLELVKTSKYQNNLNNYIMSRSILITSIIFVLIIILFKKNIKSINIKNNFNIKAIYIPIILGITISLIYNLSLYNINNIYNFTDIYNYNNNFIITKIICTGILGPILEEVIFRYIVYNKLKKFNKPMKAIILTSLIFALFHSSIIDLIYAFLVSFIFIYLYEKYDNLIYNIIMHITLNITSIVLLPLFTNTLINYIVIFICLIILLFIRKIIVKDLKEYS